MPEVLEVIVNASIFKTSAEAPTPLKWFFFVNIATSESLISRSPTFGPFDTQPLAHAKAQAECDRVSKLLQEFAALEGKGFMRIDLNEGAEKTLGDLPVCNCTGCRSKMAAAAESSQPSSAHLH